MMIRDLEIKDFAQILRDYVTKEQKPLLERLEKLEKATAKIERAQTQFAEILFQITSPRATNVNFEITPLPNWPPEALKFWETFSEHDTR